MNSSTKQVVDGYSQPILDDPNWLLVRDEDIDLHVAADGMSRTVSIVQVHMDQCYQDDDPIVCYFCFPRIGCAVALGPGDIFMFNPQEPHCISSHCNSDDQVYCISCYLKTRVVGLNDNSNLTI